MNDCITFIGFASANIQQKFILAKLLQKKFEKIIFVPMNLHLKLLFATFFALWASVAVAQLHIAEPSHDFGTIAEEGGAVEHTFLARNNTAEPIVILSASVSCGCTKAEFSRKPILPDSTAEIKVRFLPMNYPGTFARKVLLVTSAGAKQELLVKGFVTPRKRSIEERYPIELGGGVRIATNAHNFAFVEHGKGAQSTFEVVNTSQRSVSLAVECDNPSLRFSLPAMLAPSQEATINFGYFLAENSTKYGTLRDKAYLLIDGKRAEYPLMVSGVAIDSRDEYADNVEPSIVISKNFIKFGTINSASRTQARELFIENTGEEPLRIRALESERGFFSVKMEGEATIAKGEKRILTIKIEPSALPYGAVVDRLLIVSNAPQQPLCKVRISAIVERE